jgi:hypothetical protein
MAGPVSDTPLCSAITVVFKKSECQSRISEKRKITKNAG